MGEVEKGKEQKETNESTKDEEAADSFVNEIYTSERKQEPCDEEKADETLPGNDDTNKQPSDGNAEVGKSPEQEEDTNLQDHKNTEVSPENKVDECRETQSSDALYEESPSEPADEVDEDVKPGVLTVHLIEASNLLNKDIMGKSDPYVEILFEETKVKSNTVNNSLSPQWNFISNFDVTGDDTSSIKFSVFDADFGKDQLLGSCSISIKDALSQLDSARWISLEGPESGKISIKFGFTEKQDQNEEVIDDSKEAKDTEERVEETKEPKSALEQDEKTEVVQSSDANVSSDKKEEIAADSFVNDVSEAEGRQEPTVETEKEEEKKETKESNDEVTEGEKGIFKLKKDLETEDENSGSHEAESPIETIGEIKEENNEEKEKEKKQETEEDKKDEKTEDSFVNKVSEAEGRQEPTAKPEKEEEMEETKEEKAADSFVNDVSEAEGRQEPTVETEKEEEKKETKESNDEVTEG